MVQNVLFYIRDMKTLMSVLRQVWCNFAVTGCCVMCVTWIMLLVVASCVVHGLCDWLLRQVWYAYHVWSLVTTSVVHIPCDWLLPQVWCIEWCLKSIVPCDQLMCHSCFKSAVIEWCFLSVLRMRGVWSSLCGVYKGQNHWPIKFKFGLQKAVSEKVSEWVMGI